MYRLILALALLLLAGPAWAQPGLGGGSGSPGLRVFSTGGAGVTGLTTNDCATTNAVLKMTATANTSDCSSIVDDGTNVNPDANDGAALGQSGTAWSDLFLASGGIINFGAGEVTLTSAADALTLAGGVLRLPDGTAGAPGLAFSAADTGIVGAASSLGITVGGTVQAFAVSGNWRPGADDTQTLGATTTRWKGGSFSAPIGFGASGMLVTTTVPYLTKASGTGVTVNADGEVRTLVYKVTVLSTNCIAAALTCDLTIATLPAKTFLRRVWADLTTVYACTAVCTSTTLSATLGTTAGGTELLASWDLDAAAIVVGDADGELGSSMTAAARTANGALLDGVIGSWTGTTTLTYRITSGTGNLGDGAATNLSQGTITFYLTTDVHP